MIKDNKGDAKRLNSPVLIETATFLLQAEHHANLGEYYNNSSWPVT